MGVDQYLDVPYKLAESENFDEFMKELGVGMVSRKLGASVSATVTLSKKDDVYTFSTASTFKNMSISFKLDEEFDEETIDGRHVKTTVTVDGNKLIQKQKSDVETEIVREYSENQMVATMKVNNVVCTRKYNRV